MHLHASNAPARSVPRMPAAVLLLTALACTSVSAVASHGSRRHLEECTSLLTTASASSFSITVDEEDMILVQPTTSSTRYTNNADATWTFSTSSATTYGILVEILEIDCERSFDELVLTGRTPDASSSSTFTMSGSSSPFISKLFTSGVSMTWTTDGSVNSGVGFRLRVTRQIISGRFSPSASLSGNILMREYATTLHNSNSFTKSLAVPNGREVALQATTTSAYIGGMNVAWVMSTQLASQTFEISILDMDMRSSDSVSLSTSSWSKVLSGSGSPSEPTFFVRGPLTVRVQTTSGNQAGSFDIRVVNSNLQPTVGTGAVTPPNTCGGSGSLPSPSAGGNDDEPAGPSTPSSPTSSNTDTSSGFDNIGGIIGTIFPIFIVAAVAAVAYRYYKQRQVRTAAAATIATATRTPNSSSSGSGNTGIQLNASNFAMGSATLSPQASAAPSHSHGTGSTAPSVSPYPGAPSHSYGEPQSTRSDTAISIQLTLTGAKVRKECVLQ